MAKKHQVETFYPNGNSQKHTQYGFIMAGPFYSNYRIFGVVVSEPHDTPSQCLKELLTFNRDNNEGIINVHVIAREDQFVAYGDHIKK